MSAGAKAGQASPASASRLRAAARSGLARVGLEELARRAVFAKRRVGRAFSGRDTALLRAHLAGPGPHRLQIGTNANLQPGWLNSDLCPRRRDLMHLDATRPFPLPDAAFDFVFSEHMIEHVPFRAGLHMLRECRRVLKPGGTVRISTPDLGYFIASYGKPKNATEQAYADYARDRYDMGALSRGDCYVLNHFVRAWGHCFIYDEPTLREAMAHAGFVDIRRERQRESRHPELCGLENTDRMPEGVLELVSVVLEGTVPEGRA